MRFALTLSLFILIMPITSSTASLSTINVTSTDNLPLSLSVYKGKVLLIDGMATWCEPCKIEMQYLQTVYNIVNSQANILSLGISPDSDTLDKISKFKAEFSAPWPFALDKNSEFINAYNPTTVPMIYLFNENGGLVKQWQGLTPASDILAEMGKYIQLENYEDEIAAIEESDQSSDFSGSLIEDLFANKAFQLFSFVIISIFFYVKVILKPASNS